MSYMNVKWLMVVFLVCTVVAVIADGATNQSDMSMSGEMRTEGWGVTNRAQELPVFASGPYRGLHSVYNGPRYKLTLDAKGVGLIFVKEGGVVVGKPIRMIFACQYHDRDNGNAVYGRSISTFMRPPQPVVSDRPLKINLEILYEDSVRSTITLDLKESSLSIIGVGQDPPAIRNRSRIGYGVQIPKSHDEGSLPKTLNETKALMPGWTLGLKGVQERMQKHPYWKGLQVQNVEQVEIRGPWGTQAINIMTPVKQLKARKGREPGVGLFLVYPTMPAYNGYSILRHYLANREDIGRLTVSFGADSHP
jgi:hypothetical protein